MNTKFCSPILIIALMLLGTPNVTSAQDSFADQARQVLENNAPSVVGIKGILKIDINHNGQPIGSREMPIWGAGLAIEPGLIVTCYQVVMPQLRVEGNQPGLELERNLESLKIVNETGDEFDAKLVLHDETLALAFVALDPHSETAEDYDVPNQSIDTDIELKHLDRIISVSRNKESFRFEANIASGEVRAMIRVPRTMYKASGISVGSSIFDGNGEFVGLTVAKSEEVPAVILPAKYVRELVGQAKEQQTELLTAEDETEAEDSNETSESEESESSSEEATEGESDND